MRRLTYIAVFEPANDGAYGVYFPDLPGCISYGKDFTEAERMAAEALSLHIYGMEKDADPLPSPSEPSALTVDPETSAGYLISPITIYPDLVKDRIDNRAVKTNLTIPSWLKELAEERGVNYSQLMQTALKEYLQIQ